MADNPAIAVMLSMPAFRNGLYRASSIFTVSLSFGEFAAMVSPFCLFFLLHGMNGKERAFGLIATAFTILALFTSGARGGYVSFVAMPVMLFLWMVRYSKLNSHSLVGAISFIMVSLSTVAIVGLVAFWPRLHNLVRGGGESATSTDARFKQWELAKPHIIENPLTGHGAGMASDVIGFRTAGPMTTVDSYVLTLLVETGIPGLSFFFGMIGCGVWFGIRVYLFDPDRQAELGGPLACSLMAFGVYRLVLSQRENHFLFFLIVGLVFALAKLAHDRRTMFCSAPLSQSLSWI